jgi:hypothetical protein
MVHYAKPDPSDDPEFLDWVESVVVGVEKRFKTDQTFVVKIDNWFGKRWLGFSGKTLGALGVRKTKLTLPPFIPSRVVSQFRFWREGFHPGRQRGLHVYQRSGENLQRYVEVVVHDSNIFWYSGNSLKHDRASFMAYVSTPDGHWPWYVGLQRTENWRVVEAVGIGTPELKAFERSRPHELRLTPTSLD